MAVRAYIRSDPSRQSGPLSHREVGLACLGGCLLAVAMHWPLPLYLGTDIPKDVGDPLYEAWQLAWGGHALLSQPLDYFQANAYWPLRNSLAFADALVGYAPAGLIGDGLKAAVVRYNLIFLFAYALAFVGPYLLARELGVGPVGGAVAGAAFAYAPWRLEHDGHLNVISSGGIPLALFLLVRGYRTRRTGLVLAGWLVAAWQFSLGVNLGLQLVYLLAALGLLVGIHWLRRRPRLDRRIGVATAAGLAGFLLVAIPVSRPYLQVFDDHPEARRSEKELVEFSPPLRSFLVAPADNLVWGDATAAIRNDLLAPGEQTLFPGALTLGLSLLGLVGTVYPRGLRMGLGVAVVICAVLSLGIGKGGHRLPVEPYRLLYEHAPGWEGVRTPGRLNTLTSLGLALLAAAGAHAASASLRRTSGSRGGGAAWIPLGVGVAMVCVVLAEGSGFALAKHGESLITGPPHPTVPRPPRALDSAPAPWLHIPFPDYGPRYLLWSVDGFPPLVNGAGSFFPRSSVRLRARLRGFPDRSSVALLRSLGVRTVFLHPQLAAFTPWRKAARRPVRGLPLERETEGGVVIYRLGWGAPRDLVSSW